MLGVRICKPSLQRPGLCAHSLLQGLASGSSSFHHAQPLTLRSSSAPGATHPRRRPPPWRPTFLPTDPGFRGGRGEGTSQAPDSSSGKLPPQTLPRSGSGKREPARGCGPASRGPDLGVQEQRGLLRGEPAPGRDGGGCNRRLLGHPQLRASPAPLPLRVCCSPAPPDLGIPPYLSGHPPPSAPPAQGIPPIPPGARCYPTGWRLLPPAPTRATALRAALPLPQHVLRAHLGRRCWAARKAQPLQSIRRRPMGQGLHPRNELRASASTYPARRGRPGFP